MEHILHESVIPYLQNRYALRDVIKVRVLHCSGLGEGMIDEKIGGTVHVALGRAYPDCGVHPRFPIKYPC